MRWTAWLLGMALVVPGLARGQVDTTAPVLLDDTLDTDGDGIADATDNCKFFWNPGQEDLDGDGIGDVCQCGDLDFDRLVTPADVGLLRLALANPLGGPLSEEARQRCIVIGPVGPCSMLHAVVMARFALGLEPAVGDGCQIFDATVDNDLDGWTELEGDCDDMNPLARPGELEICDGIDNDCDALVDEDTGGSGCDSRLLGVCSAGQDDCQAGVLACVPTTAPSAETCNQRDDDCDGQTDEDFDLNGDASNCGICGNRCSPTFVCSGGICVLPDVCGDGIVNPTSEQCDGFTDSACTGRCLSNCRCAPEIRGIYSGFATQTTTGCSDPLNNGTLTGIFTTATISDQIGGRFSGIASQSFPAGDRSEVLLAGSINESGQLSGDASWQTFFAGTVVAGGQGTFLGQLSGNTLSATVTGRFTFGETCSLTTSLSISR